MRTILPIYIAILLALISGCAKVPAGGQPIYLHIDSASLAEDGPAYGSSSSRIPDTWVETGSQDLGAYEAPVNIPILATGDVPILLSAGIYDNGIISSRAVYPFYRPDTFTLHHVTAGQTYTYHPVYHYFANTKFALQQDFEVSKGFTNLVQDANGYEGKCGAITLQAQDTVILSEQGNGKVINTNGREAYVEMNYRMSSDKLYCKVGLEIISHGVMSYYTLIDLKPTSEWKKVYLNFSNTIGNNRDCEFRIFFAPSKDAGQEATMYVDNVKLLYFD